jgi:hypothetical protein
MNKLRGRFNLAFFLIAVSLALTSCQFTRYVFYNFADIQDYKKFPSRSLHHDSLKFTFHTSGKGVFPKIMSDGKKRDVSLEEYLEENKTVAFLIIKNDTIQYERYFMGYDKVTIKHLLQMTSGLKSNESYINPFGDAASFY